MRQTESPVVPPARDGDADVPLAGLFMDPFHGTARGEAIESAVQKEQKPLRGRIPGEIGVWVFMAGDAIAFTLIFTVIVWGRMDQPEVYERSRQALHIDFGAINTVLLLIGSLLVVRAIRALRTGSTRAPQLFLLTAGCGVLFCVNKAIEYSWLIAEGHVMSENGFFSYYYVATVLHLFHLLFGIVGMLICSRIARRSVLVTNDLRNVESFGAYWHLVDLLWVVLFPLLYLMRI
jgi:nitric oxide reductase NorE protein